MINLSMGLPGAGKTLFTIAFVKEMVEKEHRPVFYSGINDLALDWYEHDAEKWMECPEDAIIVIDECQRIFRPRGSGAKVPEFISGLETHRHKGFDIFLITQHPMLMDADDRRLAKQHWHICRKFGMQRATVLQFESCKEQPLSHTAIARCFEWKYPKEVFKYYKSANSTPSNVDCR
jgi:zona occludens toxin (predicted ATPase)